MAEVSILSGTRCELGEGPLYDPARDTLFWFDIVGRKRHAMNMADRMETSIDLPEMTSAMAVIDGDRDLLLTETGLSVLDTKSGGIVQHVSVEADNAATRSNDARVHPSGAFWFGTMGKRAEKEAGAIYRYFRGTVDKLYGNVTIPNAICFSPDGAKAYFADTAAAKLMSVAVDPATGAPVSDPEVFIDHSGGKGGLDGAVIDADGNLWNARWGASALDCYSPSGDRLLTIAVPARQPSCPAFVGDGLLAVTSAWEGMNHTEREADTHAGSTFLVSTPVRPKYESAVAL
ncbi:SMP-30/gluconolactonase/LRE family protein [Oricola cellulosilytica]|uniref:SMP-30/gluconolactonase/LRE family protein n=1 Tax=Oricola cellulosilytica TaxID=1429082 RepID=A0A4R0PET5_9HYPH|nr:SMP-30/gluconolactonase/LRE family protein [Oricola cellulosilytica]TCD16327.1 SMP-30/gluconolactonase/LRE family protein [Oricola cellulosilytica]